MIARLYSHTLFFFFFNDTATTEIYTLSLHDALPISFSVRARPLPEASANSSSPKRRAILRILARRSKEMEDRGAKRSEEHTSELQSRPHLVCRLLLEKKKQVIATASLSHFYHSVAST